MLIILRFTPVSLPCVVLNRSGTAIAKASTSSGTFPSPEAKADEMLNFLNQRRAWDDLIIVFLKCGCSGAGLTISAAMAITHVAWKAIRRKAAQESGDRFSPPSATTNDLTLRCRPPECLSGGHATPLQIPASSNLPDR
jgi:hypothetical protein